MKKKMKKYGQTGMAMIGTGVGLSIGSQVAGELGATSTQTAIGKMTGKMPAMGSMVGTGMALDVLQSSMKVPKMKKKK